MWMAVSTADANTIHTTDTFHTTDAVRRCGALSASEYTERQAGKGNTQNRKRETQTRRRKNKKTRQTDGHTDGHTDRQTDTQQTEQADGTTSQKKELKRQRFRPLRGNPKFGID